MVDSNNAIAAALAKKKLAEAGTDPAAVGRLETQVAPVAASPELVTKEPVAEAGHELILSEGEKAYLMPSAPCSFVLSNGTRLSAADGVIHTSDPDHIAQLDAAVKCGNIGRFEGQVFSSRQIAPDIQ